MTELRMWIARLLVVFAAGLSGCAHQIAFQDLHYDIGTTKQDATLVAVIDENTLNNTVSIRSFMTGIAHSWDAQPGEMLKQIADIELPQMFARYEFTSTYQERNPNGRRLSLNLTIPSYTFADFRATITVNAVAKEAYDKVLFQKSYRAQGETQGARMFWAGPFGMKSAVRQSSLDAYRKIFSEMRGDLIKALESPYFH